ncbi:MAG: hypothetical protein KAI03_04655 [Candidatus Aureabacteria bacterium]|nr:hypothetical protein [Candidatus Auribacterota bacterium]
MRPKTMVSWIMYLLLIGFACYAILLQIYDRPALSRLCREDGIIEWLTSIFYFLASFIFIYTCKKEGFKNVWYWGFFILFLLIAGEEISWGQRLFEFSTPGLLKDLNIQKETNLHNIKGIHGSIRGLGLLIVFGICYIIPITNKFVGWARSFYRKRKMPIYPLWLMGLPTVAVLFMAIPRLLFNEAVFNLDEMGEIYLSIGFLLFSLSESKLT